jgi:NAD(P)H-dependent flavin oxidoreductase YrpB (nitropropane dioxygenase family)
LFAGADRLTRSSVSGAPLGVPLVSAGGVGTASEFVEQLSIGYAAVQLGTRFIATTECTASDAYKRAIVEAEEADITLTERLSGVPVSVINNDFSTAVLFRSMSFLPSRHLSPVSSSSHTMPSAGLSMPRASILLKRRVRLLLRP